MKKLSLSKSLGLALGCAALALGAIYASADSKHSNEFSAHGGTSFVVHPTGLTDAEGNPTYSHTVDGVVRVSGLGDCTFHADVLIHVLPSGDTLFTDNAGDQTFTITTVGGDKLYASITGGGSPNPANSTWIDFYYHVTFTGGTGKLLGARGTAELVDGLAIYANGQPGLGSDDSPGELPIPFPPAADLVSPASTDLTGKAVWIIFGHLDY